jgi:Flp pilus assembly protein TadG
MWRAALPPKTTPRNRNRRRGLRGNVIVEFALIMTPFFALTLATIELSLPIFKRSTFLSAVRDGCRFGITYQTSYAGTTYGNQTAAIQAVVQANSMGFLTTSNILVDYYDGVSFAKVTGNANANADGNILQVSLTGYTHQWIAPINWLGPGSTYSVTPTPLGITAVSADRMESLPPGATRPTP